MSQHGADILLHRHNSCQKRGRLALAGLVVIDASEDDRRAAIAFPVLDIGNRVPVHGMDAIVEFLFLIFRNKIRGVNDAQELLARLWMYPQVHTEQSTDTDQATGLLRYLADDRVLGRFTTFDVTTRLRDDYNARRTLLDNQELLVPFDDGTYGEVGG